MSLRLESHVSRQQAAGTCFDQQINFDPRPEAEDIKRLGGYTDFQIHTAIGQQIYLRPVLHNVLDRTLEQISRARLADPLSRNNNVIRANSNSDRGGFRQRDIWDHKLATPEVNRADSLAFVMISNLPR